MLVIKEDCLYTWAQSVCTLYQVCFCGHLRAGPSLGHYSVVFWLWLLSAHKQKTMTSKKHTECQPCLILARPSSLLNLPRAEPNILIGYTTEPTLLNQSDQPCKVCNILPLVSERVSVWSIAGCFCKLSLRKCLLSGLIACATSLLLVIFVCWLHPCFLPV